MERIKESELIITPDGSIYHLNLKPGDIARNIILVGDPGRVPKISKYFDKILLQRQNREMVTHTGLLNGKTISVISTGMGTDNIDIVMNELDALVNIDFEKRQVREKLTSLNIVRLGTSGAIRPEIPVNTVLASTHGIGLDGLLKFYRSENILDNRISRAFIEQTQWNDDLPFPYVVPCSDKLMNTIGKELNAGMTATAPGFYGPQGRVLRIPLQHPRLMERLRYFEFEGKKIVNFEMETSALYGLGKILGHHTLTVCAVIANRATNTYSEDYRPVIDRLIKLVLDRFSRL